MELNLTKEQEASKKWYEENGFKSLLDSVDQIEEMEDVFNSELNELITHHANKKPREMNAEEQSQWNTNALRDMVRVNQAMFGVIQLIREMRLGDDK